MSRARGIKGRRGTALFKFPEGSALANDPVNMDMSFSIEKIEAAAKSRMLTAEYTIDSVIDQSERMGYSRGEDGITRPTPNFSDMAQGLAMAMNVTLPVENKEPKILKCPECGDPGSPLHACPSRDEKNPYCTCCEDCEECCGPDDGSGYSD